MKKRFLPFSLLLVIMVLGQSVMADGGHYVPRAKETTNAEVFLNSMRVNQLTGLVDPAWMIAASKTDVTRTDVDTTGLVYWLTMGPDNIGGRTTSIVYNNKKTSEVYIGSIGGGVFRTTNGISWHQVGENLMVSCMTQAEDGTIYVGTGEGNNAVNYNGMTDYDYADGFLGSGIYTIKDNVMSKTALKGTEPKSLDEVGDFSFINEITLDGELIAVSTNAGLRYRAHATDTVWKYAMTFDTTTNMMDSLKGVSLRVKLIKDHTFVASVDGKVYVGPLDNMVCCSGEKEIVENDVITYIAPTPSEGLVDVTACTNDDASVIYAALINKNGKNGKIYCSRDLGASWTIILPSADSYNVYGSMGTFNPGLVVDKSNLDRLYVLGIDMWRLEKPSSQSGGFYLATKMSNTSRLHGINSLVFEPNSNAQKGYVASDGGIYKIEGNNGGFSFVNCNRGYVSARCLNVAPTTEVKRLVAGVLDRGPILLKGLDNTNNLGTCDVLLPELTPVISSAYSESNTSATSVASVIRPDVFIMTTKDGGLKRTESAGELYDDVNFTSNQSFSFSGYRMPMALWEGFEVENSTDSVWFKCTQNQVVGEEVQCFSHNGEYPFTYELPVNMTYDTVNPDLSDSLLVPDPVMAKLFLPNASGSKHNIFVTFDALQFNKVADWYQIASITGTPTSMVVSVDGDVLFIGTKQGKLFRISNLKAVVDANTANTTTAITAEIALPTTQCITSIAISDEDNSKVVVTLGSYGNDTYVLYSDNAMDDDAVFEARQGKHLPKMPVYSSVYTVYKYTNKEGQLVKEDHVLIGTEHGVYRTTNIGSSLPEWTAEMKMMGDVPVLDMKQQKVLKEDQKVIINGVETIFPGVRNHGIIYAATYGRGLFRCETYHTFYAPQDVNETPAPTNKSKLVMYPNPVRDAAKVSFELNSNTSVSYQVFDINGRMVKVENAGNYSAGKHEINVSVDGLAKGTYVLRLNAGSQSSSVKFMVF